MNRHFLNGFQIPEKKAKTHVERVLFEHGYDPVEIRDIWEQANEANGEEFRDSLIDIGIEIVITH